MRVKISGSGRRFVQKFLSSPLIGWRTPVAADMECMKVEGALSKSKRFPAPRVEMAESGH